MTRSVSDPKMKTFFIIWFGQFISDIGSGLSGFALGVWVYQQTGSATKFAFTVLLNMLPHIVVAPLAGAAVDRWDRRKVMAISDSAAAFSTLIVAALLFTGRLELWHIYLATLAISLGSTFHSLAYSTITTILMPKAQLGRANGLIQLGQSAAPILSPLMAGILVMTIGMGGVLFIDFATFVVAMATLFLVRIPNYVRSSDDEEEKKQPFLRKLTYGWTFIKARPGLRTLLTLFAITNFAIAMVQVLIVPLILSFSTAAALGTVLSMSGSGLLAGSLILSVWGGPKHRIRGILMLWTLQGLLLIVACVQANLVLIAIMLFGLLLTAPIIQGCSQVIWQSKTPIDVQGRVFAVRRMIAFSCTPLAYLLVGPLVDKVFTPALSEGGALAGSVGRIIGVGPGRGISFLFICLGVLGVIAATSGALYPRLRNVEHELPDVLPEIVSREERSSDEVLATTKEVAVGA
jgi:MFS transporter, DHA3 family, macrolide efflux protein